ncbi:hypothetical protein F2Q69_00006457 [Brassica cretica]|uniref:Uncharacterized protein n=1 Tax=Brassica cretica TaxID=69181 RepID=A0A8S9PC34_BRACR|nr:hypothetical protein F2Q69_00006457 [Brassica cretica]
MGSCFCCALARLATFYLRTSSGQDTSLEGRDGCGDASLGNGHLLLIEAGYVALQGFHPVLEDFVEAIRGFLQVPAAGKLFHELITENREGGYGPIG